MLMLEVVLPICIHAIHEIHTPETQNLWKGLRYQTYPPLVAVIKATALITFPTNMPNLC